MTSGLNFEPIEPLLPEKLYKFIPKDYAEAFMSGSSIRLRTLADVRRVEAHKGVIDAPLKNASGVSASGSVRSPEALEFKPAKARLQKLGLRIESPPPSIPTALEDVSVGGPSMHILCTSLSFSPELAAAISPDYDRCIVINDPAELAKAIGKGLKAKFGMRRTTGIFESVKYGERIYRPSDPNWIANPFLKSREYESQKEFRFAFHDLPNGEPFNLSCDTSAAKMEIVWER